MMPIMNIAILSIRRTLFGLSFRIAAWPANDRGGERLKPK
jgi:hypothetical protein